MLDLDEKLQSFLSRLKVEKGIKNLPTVSQIRGDYDIAINFFNNVIKPIAKKGVTYEKFQEEFGTPTRSNEKPLRPESKEKTYAPLSDFAVSKVRPDAIQGALDASEQPSNIILQRERPIEKISLQVYANVVTFPHKIEVIVLLALLLLGILYKNKVGAIYHNRLKPIAIGFTRGAKKYKGIVLASVLAVLLLTNPSINDFYDYMGVNRNNYHAHLQRKINLLFISLYTDKQGNEYLGLLGNFIPL